MRCSSCSAVVRPVVALDVDGTLGDYHGHFLKFLEGYLGRPPVRPAFRDAGYRGEQRFRNWCIRAYGISEATWYDIKLAYRQGGMKRTMPVYHDASQLSLDLIEEGAEVWITTTRPHNRLDNIDPDTQHWLARHGIGYDQMIYGDDKYQQLAKLVDPERVVAVLDDEAEQYDKAERAFGSHVPILHRNGYNSAIQRSHMVATLPGARVAILRRIATWQLTNKEQT